MLESIRADIGRVTAREPSVATRLALVLFHPGLHAVLLYRLSRWCCGVGLTPIGMLIAYVSTVLTGSQISPRARIGKGLMIYHPHGIVVGATAVLGDHCTLTHLNMIGQRHGDADRPVIGDRFFAGSGAKILGAITIGNDVRVGANAVVLDSLPDDVSVTGIPARITSAAARRVAVR